MGDLIGGIIGGIGSIFGSNQAAKKADEGATTALTGYNYLRTNPVTQDIQNIGDDAARAGQSVQTAEQNLLLNGGDPSQNPAFQNYLNSTGYKFQLDQGVKAISGSAAAKGILNSGATAKALTGYGTNLASNYFSTYLGQLANLNGQFQTSANAGLAAAQAVGAAGTQGGNAAGQLQASAGQSAGTGTAQAFNYLGAGVQSGLNNFFGNIGGSGNGAGAPAIFNGLVP